MIGYDTLPDKDLNVHSFFKDETTLDEYLFSVDVKEVVAFLSINLFELDLLFFWFTGIQMNDTHRNPVSCFSCPASR
jgi:hypothetical protein